eukprot:1157789-Pelagomonas_calceolata.AAC.1
MAASLEVNQDPPLLIIQIVNQVLSSASSRLGHMVRELQSQLSAERARAAQAVSEAEALQRQLEKAAPSKGTHTADAERHDLTMSGSNQKGQGQELQEQRKLEEQKQQDEQQEEQQQRQQAVRQQQQLEQQQQQLQAQHKELQRLRQEAEAAAGNSGAWVRCHPARALYTKAYYSQQCLGLTIRVSSALP